jgi:hypothetical protein
MDVKQYDCGQRDVDDEAVERGRGILGKTAGLPQNDFKHEAEDQQTDVHHDVPLIMITRSGSACLLPVALRDGNHGVSWLG